MNKICEHIRFTAEMTTAPGVICFIFGIIFLIVGSIKEYIPFQLFGVGLVLYAFLLFEINWNHYYLCDKLEEMKK